MCAVIFAQRGKNICSLLPENDDFLDVCVGQRKMQKRHPKISTRPLEEIFDRGLLHHYPSACQPSFAAKEGGAHIAHLNNVCPDALLGEFDSGLPCECLAAREFQKDSGGAQPVVGKKGAWLEQTGGLGHEGSRGGVQPAKAAFLLAFSKKKPAKAGWFAFGWHPKTGKKLKSS